MVLQHLPQIRRLGRQPRQPNHHPTAIVTITAAGNLVLLNKATNSIVWSSNTTTNSTTFAALGDDGNLVLNATTTTTVWKSFDHPTDTFLPGMRVSNFTSWRSSNDPSPGNYTIGVNPIGSQLQLYMWEGSMIRWRSGQWDRSSFTGLPGMQALNLYGFNMVPDGNGGNYLTYTVFNSSLLRFVMDTDGLERTLIYDRMGPGTSSGRTRSRRATSTTCAATTASAMMEVPQRRARA
ncbi:hypothetical protein QJS10_CPB21g00776 [Acorus calamus]|uniref:Bulb-type lectin domain-containing protein n=1 Tax=Acorus calamus TaxID=4465 RepID=A0AAV9C6S9_ACOCL|nr:hypothetical protein QJS10_CPB21g00776 [Acorus calamus]